MGMKLESSWHRELEAEIEQPYIAGLKDFVAKQKLEGKVVYPPESLIFNAFLHTPFDKVKVVIIGQDPYHGPGQAHGLCFSVPCGIPVPPSLKNIYLELEQDLGIPPPKDGCLSSWAKQGVLLLNATLTVRAGEPKSHYGLGWERFTDAVVRRLIKREDPIVFVLWGKSAQEKLEHILQDQKTAHAVLTAPHPSPFSAYSGFFGCRHFSKINAFLEKWGKTPIDWRLS
ncbi:MAG: uracil-DNA glycosylase [Verrucomicrobia bacterium]|nr:uracil-DNA glycosylase [Verrucomicrobiota bacterium]